VYARLTVVRGPVARGVRRACPVDDRSWPRGARRTPCTRNWWSSVARRRQPDRRPQVTPPQSPLSTN